MKSKLLKEILFECIDELSGFDSGRWRETIISGGAFFCNRSGKSYFFYGSFMEKISGAGTELPSCHFLKNENAGDKKGKFLDENDIFFE